MRVRIIAPIASCLWLTLLLVVSYLIAPWQPYTVQWVVVYIGAICFPAIIIAFATYPGRLPGDKDTP